MRVIGLLAFGAVMFAGCAATSDDPTQGGFFGGISGLQSGAYQQRIDEKEGQLKQLQETQQDLETETLWLASFKGSLEEYVAEETAKLTQLEQNLAILERNISSLSGEHARTDQRMSDLQQRVATLKKQLDAQQEALTNHNSTNDPEAQARFQELKAQRNALLQEYESLLDLSLQLVR